MTPRDQATRGRGGRADRAQGDVADLGRGGQADRRDLPVSGLTLEVVAGHPSADEIAALTVALAAALAAGDRRAGPGRPGPGSGWADRSRMLGAPLRPGRDAWRRSAWPGRAGRLR